VSAKWVNVNVKTRVTRGQWCLMFKSMISQLRIWDGLKDLSNPVQLLLGLTSSSSRLNQSSNISSFVTLRRGLTTTSLKVGSQTSPQSVYWEADRHKGSLIVCFGMLIRCSRSKNCWAHEIKAVMHTKSNY